MVKKEILEISPKQLRKMQLLQVDLLAEVDRICKKHNILYSVEGGTLLGTIRHKGFIPWDDDIDIAMTRNEFVKFCHICNQEINNEKYFFQTHDTDKYYRWGYAKVLLKGTSFVRQGQEHLKMKRGVYVEIFPMDGIPINPIERRVFNFLRVACRKLMWSEVGKISSDKAILRLWYTLLNKIPVDRAFQVLDFLSKRYNETNTNLVTCLSFPDCWIKDYQGFKREYYEQTKTAEFEGKQIQIPVKDKELLVTLYGTNYMELPPEKERVSHLPVSYYDF